MTVALRVEKVSKQYRIYERPGDRLKESLTRGRLRRHKEFWALRDLTSKSKPVLRSASSDPTAVASRPCCRLFRAHWRRRMATFGTKGRIAALLELGAGFDPEFTGVENVYMNASLLGLTRRETEALFPAIERFAEIGPFLYQPVKTYSSGMYVRLAFAIAASVEPDILIIDEALAVGDAVFQHRCLRRINELHERGATVLFVSHDAAAVRALCSRAILLRGGSIIADGKPADVLNLYQKIIMEREQAYEAEAALPSQRPVEAAETLAPVSCAYRHGDGSAEIVGAELTDVTQARVDIVESGEPLTLRMAVRFHQEVTDPVIGFLLRTSHGIHAYGTNTKEQQLEFGTVRGGELVEVSFAFHCWLGVDQYTISLAVHSREGLAYDWLDAALFVRVTSVNLTEGVANLNASVTTSQRALQPDNLQPESQREGATIAADHKTLSYG